MYDQKMREHMLHNGFWPIYEYGEEKMATALGNLTYRPELWKRFGLKHGDIRGNSPGTIIVFRKDDDA